MKATVETRPPAMHALLYYCSFGDYVEVLNVPAGMEEFVGKVCAYTISGDLVPLESPRNARHLSGDELQNTQVRKLAAGEKITLTIRGE